MALSNISISLLGLYALICIGLGWWSSRRQTEQDYLIGSRKLGTFSFIATVIASYISGGALVAYTAYVYRFGISALWIYVGVALGFLVLIWYGLRIRKEGKIKNFHTISDWLRDKINNKVAVLAAILILFVYLGSLANQFIAGGAILSAISGLSYEFSLLFSGGVILIYLILGGFRSVVRTDVFQYIVMLILFIVFGFIMLGEQRTIVPELLNPVGIGVFLSISFLLYGVATVLVGSEYWQRVYAARDDSVVKKGLIGSAILIIITGLALSLIGLTAASVSPGLDSNKAAVYAFNHLLPQSLLGLGLILVFAAVMSSADTLIFVLSLSVAKDYFGHKFYKGMNQEQLMKVTRTLVVIFSVLGISLAYFFRDIIQVILTIAGVLLCMVPVVVCSFHWKLKPRAAFISLLSGPIYVFILMITGNLTPELVIGSLLISGIVLAVASIVLKR